MLKNNIDDIIKQVSENAKRRTDTAKDNLTNFMEDRKKEAESQFADAEYDGENDVVVESPYWNGDSITLEANGKSILFIEFGTGILNNFDKHPQLEEFGYSIGGYGGHHGEMAGWFFASQGRDIQLTSKGYNYGFEVGQTRDGETLYWTYGNIPNAIMYNLSRYIRTNIIKGIWK